MTYIEFFDENIVDNFCACLSKIPEKVIFVGDDKNRIERYTRRFEQVLSERGLSVAFEVKGINRNKLFEIVEKLSEIVEKETECVFELTGGSELYLVGLGMIAEKYPDRNIQMQRYNVRENKLYDCDDNGRLIREQNVPMLTVAENVNLFGGNVVFADEAENGTYLWTLDDAFIGDVEDMWEICRQCNSMSQWNSQTQFFGTLVSAAGDDGSLSFSVPRSALGGAFFHDAFVVDRLKEYGLISGYSHTDERVSVTFKSEQVKRCLTKAGQVLELIVYIEALDAVDNDGAPVYNDVLTGVYMQWNSTASEEERLHVTDNEIDVLMMHGVIPVFVSCKNGFVEIDELYKLNTVAQRFGGKYAKKVLVATALPKKDSAMALRQRASEMRIDLIEPLAVSAEDFRQRLSNAWNKKDYKIGVGFIRSDG